MTIFLLIHCVLMASGGCADLLILPPAPRSIAGDGAARRTIAHETGVIEAFTARSPGASPGPAQPRAFVLQFTGGNAAEAASFVASRWQHRPVEVWIVNYPGYGRSTGPRTLRRWRARR